ncbi:MAG: hypothetical protein ACRDY6_17455 [Acidimicrobiia bacterium]
MRSIAREIRASRDRALGLAYTSDSGGIISFTDTGGNRVGRVQVG